MATAAELVVEVRGTDVNLEALLKRIEGGLRQTDAAGQRTADVLGGGLAAGQQKAASAALAHAQAEARLLAASGDLPGAINAIANALQGVDRNSTAAIRAETQLVNLQTRMANELRGVNPLTDAFKNGLLSLAGSFGLVTSGAALLSSAVGRVEEGFKLRSTLDEQRRSLGAFLGDVQRGNSIFQAAAEFGKKYGFTQKEMGEAAREAAPLIRLSTASVEKQLEVLGRLAALNPEEGFKGAVFSTKELASGDITSLVERFNISRDAARRMKEEIAGGADVIAVLDRALAGMGVTAEILAQRTEGAAGATRSYEQAQEKLTLAMGRFAEGPGKAVINTLAQIVDQIARATTKSGDAQQFGALAVSGAKSFADYGQRIQFVNQQLAQVGEHLPVLSEAQFNYAQNLIKTGTAADQAVQRAQALNATFIEVGRLQADVASTGEISAQALDRLSNSMLQTAASGPAGAAAVTSLLHAYEAGGISAAQFQQALDNLAQQHVLVAQSAAMDRIEEYHLTGANLNAGSAAQQHAAALASSSAQALIAQARAQELAFEQQRLFDAAQTAARGMGTAEQEAAILAAQFRLTKNEAVDLINAMRAIAGKGTISGAAGILGGGAAPVRVPSIPRLSGGGGGGGGGAPRLSDQVQLDNSLIAQAEKTNNQLEDAAAKHEKRILDIERAANEKRLAADDSFRLSRLEGEGSFYDQIRSIKNQGIVKNADAEYQAAILEAEKIGGDEGKAYLDARTKAIQGRAKRLDEIATAEKEGDKSTAENLRGILAIEDRAEAERLRQIKEGGSAIEKERQSQLADEDASYTDAQRNIMETSGRATQAKILNAQRSGKAIDVENLSLQNQVSLLDQINAKTKPGSAGGTPTSRPGASPTTAAAPSPAVAGGDVGPIVAALQAAQDAIVSALARVERAEQDTTRAVGRAGASGGVAG